MAVPEATQSHVTRGARFAKYEILAELATGGMASVYVARQVGSPGLVPGMERLVAVKRIHPHLLKLPQFREMFQDEARVASLIRHTNVVRLLDIGDDGGELFLVLDYVESVSLASLLRDAVGAKISFPPRVAARIAADALLGLHAAHELTDARGRALDVVHRDVSPQNILVGVDGVTQLIDFGIARASVRAAETTGGVIKGKLAYMSPEQAKGVPLDRRTDLFSLGVVLFEALTGRRLFTADGSDGSNVLLNVLLEPIEPPSRVAPGVPPAVDAVVERALERVREERFQTASEFHDALAAAVPPASAREVAEFLDRCSGHYVRRRRDELRRILEELGEPGFSRTKDIPRLSGDPADRQGGATGMASAFDDTRAARRSRASVWAGLVALVSATLVGGTLYWSRNQVHPPATTHAAESTSARPESSPVEVVATPVQRAEAEVAVPPPSGQSASAASSSSARPRALQPKHRAASSASATAEPAASNSASSSRVAPSDIHENPY
jgi:serine/threonine protein kinase